MLIADRRIDDSPLGPDARVDDREVAPGRLAGDLLHYSYRDLRHQIDTVNSGSFYTVANHRVTSNTVNGYKGFLKGTYLRAPQAPQSLFAAESMIDELAREANMDPIAFRIQNIDAGQTAGNARWIGVLNAVARAAARARL